MLLVEDEQHLASGIKLNFELEGYEVDVAVSAREAAAKMVGNGPYDIIVLDILLPDSTGFELCKRLRDGGIFTPVLMLTALGGTEDRVKGLEVGADDYLVKPFELDELEARLAALVRRARGEQAGGALRVADLEMDPATRTVRRAGCELSVPPIALMLLERLMRQSHRVVSREELEREVWGDEPPDSDALRAHLHVLRAAIDHPFDRPLLHTVHGIGYRIADPDALHP